MCNVLKVLKNIIIISLPQSWTGAFECKPVGYFFVLIQNVHMWHWYIIVNNIKLGTGYESLISWNVLAWNYFTKALCLRRSQVYLKQVL